MSAVHPARPGRASFAEIARAALTKHVQAARRPDAEWFARPNLCWVRWRRADGWVYYLGIRRHLRWMTGEVALSREPRDLEELPLGIPEAEFATGHRTRLGELLGHGDRWWQGGNDAKSFLERVDWIALQMAVKAEAYLLRHMKR